MAVSVSYFLKVALDHGGSPPRPFRIFVDHVTILYQTLCNIEDRALRHKIGNSWKLLLTAATELCLKCDRALRSDAETLRQI